MFRFACLGSGSKGNAWVVEAAAGPQRPTRVLVDCGLTLRETLERLARLNLLAEDIDAIVLTHEHSDHVRSAASVAQRAGCPVWLTHGCRAMLDAQAHCPEQLELFHAETPFALGAFEVLPYTIPHDAREPVHFVFSDGDRRLGMLTDAGHVTPHMTVTLQGCEALVIECNHEPERVRASTRYPESLKRRILGPHGHLDNAASATLLRQVAHPGLQHVVAAHLSEENNTPTLARAALAGALNCSDDWIAVADQETGLAWRTLGA